MIIKVNNEHAIIDKLFSYIEKISNDAIQNRGKFYIGLSGGSVVKYLCESLPSVTTDWSKWVLAFCDERVVPEDSEDSTFGTYKKLLLPKCELKEQQFLTIKQGVSGGPASLNQPDQERDNVLSYPWIHRAGVGTIAWLEGRGMNFSIPLRPQTEEAAKDYNQKLTQAFGSDSYTFDLLLLGMGPDGHTCSLFPSHPLSDDKGMKVAYILDSPKPPAERITLTFPIINAARNCIFAISGAGKADMVKRILKDKEDLPAGRVKPQGSLYWIVDDAAALHL